MTKNGLFNPRAHPYSEGKSPQHIFNVQNAEVEIRKNNRENLINKN